MAAETAARNVDLPAFGRPTRPTSAISFSRSQTSRSSPARPGLACRGARLTGPLKRVLPKPPLPPAASRSFAPIAQQVTAQTTRPNRHASRVWLGRALGQRISFFEEFRDVLLCPTTARCRLTNFESHRARDAGDLA